MGTFPLDCPMFSSQLFLILVTASGTADEADSQSASGAASGLIAVDTLRGERCPIVSHLYTDQPNERLGAVFSLHELVATTRQKNCFVSTSLKLFESILKKCDSTSHHLWSRFGYYNCAAYQFSVGTFGNSAYIFSHMDFSLSKRRNIYFFSIMTNRRKKKKLG